MSSRLQQHSYTCQLVRRIFPQNEKCLKSINTQQQRELPLSHCSTNKLFVSFLCKPNGDEIYEIPPFMVGKILGHHCMDMTFSLPKQQGPPPPPPPISLFHTKRDIVCETSFRFMDSFSLLQFQASILSLNKFWAFGGNVVAMNKDSCGVGFVAELSGESSRKTVNATTLVFACECEYEYGACGVTDALEMLVRMMHRGACSVKPTLEMEHGSWWVYLTSFTRSNGSSPSSRSNPLREEKAPHDSNGSSPSSRSNPLREEKLGKSNTQRARSQLLETHLAKLFKQKV
ncbi:hypothetical protein JHK85_001067 [Glycine max]|nr:hypothetical protein JHK85_001067 [Glycine max]